MTKLCWRQPFLEELIPKSKLEMHQTSGNLSVSFNEKSLREGTRKQKPAVCTYHIYPTPLLGQDMSQGQFLSGV